MAWWTRVALFIGAGLPLIGILSFCLLIDLTYDDREPGNTLPELVWRLGEPQRGDLVALRDYQYDMATVVGKPDDEIRPQPASPWPIRLVVSGPAAQNSVLELGPNEDLTAFPPRVPRGSLLVYDLYYGVNGDSGTAPVAGLVSEEQVIGVVLNDWRNAAARALGGIAAAVWLASLAYLVGRFALRGGPGEAEPRSRDGARGI